MGINVKDLPFGIFYDYLAGRNVWHVMHIVSSETGTCHSVVQR